MKFTGGLNDRSMVLSVSKVPMLWAGSLHTQAGRQTDMHAKTKVISSMPYCTFLSPSRETQAHFW